MSLLQKSARRFERALGTAIALPQDLRPVATSMQLLRPVALRVQELRLVALRVQDLRLVALRVQDLRLVAFRIVHNSKILLSNCHRSKNVHVLLQQVAKLACAMPQKAWLTRFGDLLGQRKRQPERFLA